MAKKKHWTQLPGGKAKVRAAAIKGHKTKKKLRKSRAERVVRKAISEMPTKLDVLIMRRETLHEDISDYLRSLSRTTEVDDSSAANAKLTGAILLRYIRDDISSLRRP